MSNKSLVMFIAGALFILLFLRQCNQISTLKQDVKYAQEDANRAFSNFKAAQDSVTVLINQNGDQLAQIRSFEIDLSQKESDLLQMTNKYKKALNLNKDLKGVNALISAELELKDSLLAAATTTKIDSTTSIVNFNSFNDFGSGNTRSLTGSTKIRINPNNWDLHAFDSQFTIGQTLSLVAAIEEGTDGVDRLKLSTSYPGLEIRDIENINLVNTRLNRTLEKKAGWSIGIGVGYGINLNNNQVISTGPSIGLGLYWSPKFLRF